MPKSRHGKSRRPQYRNKPRQPQTAQAGAATNASTAPAATTSAAPKATTAKTIAYTAATTAQYPFFTSELKRIGIITAIILIVLIALAFILR